MSSPDKEFPFERVAVIGPGLLGGSIARALAARMPPVVTQVWGRREEPLDILRAGDEVALASTDVGAVVDGASLVVLATPVGVMARNAEAIVASGKLRPGCVVTDVGSVKESVVGELEPVFRKAGAKFVGSHPMAGSEKSGIDHATADLFEGAACLVTPTNGSDAEAVVAVESFWSGLGCRVSRLSPEEHDRAVALISHLPHVAASLLVQTALADSPGLGAFAGGGFRDSTRIAAGSADLWTEILLENREAVIGALRQYQTKIGETLAFLEGKGKEELRQFLTEAKVRRENLGGAGNSGER